MQSERTVRWVWAIASALVASLALAGVQQASEPAPMAAAGQPGETPPLASTGEDVAPSAEDSTSGRSAVRVHLDPLTGEILRRPAEDRPAGVSGPRGWLNTYGDDLVQEPLPGGGFKVDLRGRFQSAVVATIDPETGAVEVDCVVSPDPDEAPDGR